MKPLLIIALIVACGCSSLTNQAQDNSGFTNKAEAKNLMVNGLKEGKWVE